MRYFDFDPLLGEELNADLLALSTGIQEAQGPHHHRLVQGLRRVRRPLSNDGH